MAGEVMPCLVRMGQARWGVARPPSGRGRTRRPRGWLAGYTRTFMHGAPTDWTLELVPPR